MVKEKTALNEKQFIRSILEFLGSYQPYPETGRQWREFFADWIEYRIKEGKVHKVVIESRTMSEEELIGRMQDEINKFLRFKERGGRRRGKI